MTHKTSIRFSMIVALTMFIAVGMFSLEAQAQRGGHGGGHGGGGHGAKPSMGKVGGGGARHTPNVSRPNMSRPNAGHPNVSRPTAHRPNVSKPSFANANARPNINRPSMPNTRPATRPQIGATRPTARPDIGGARPGLGGAGGKPNMTRPSSRPNIANRPTLPNNNRPNVNVPRPPKPSTRPGSGIAGPDNKLPNIGGNRPGNNWAGIGGNRPGDKPSFGNIQRPVTLPGNRPDSGGNRPGDRFPNLPDTRPGAGGNRPGIADRFPNVPNNRPGGNWPNRPNNRPIIGGGNRPGFGNDTNINIGNNYNIGNRVGNQVGNHWVNRPRWDVDPGFSRPAWGIGGSTWHDHWHDNCINHHHNWYNGCWNGYWGSNWYSPVAWGAVGWGLGSLTNSWGYSTSYYNPYYSQPVAAQSVPYDYSQPVVVNNYVSSDAQGGDAQTQSDVTSEPGLTHFDAGLAKFKSGDYQGALGDFNTALGELPSDPVVHEVRCLALFATGDYASAAAGLNSLLSAAPGMDWTTMSGLYGNTEDYSNQLRRLEQFCIAHRTDSSAFFVLAYHYLVTGAKDHAIEALKVVVKNQPRDVTAKRMLDALAPSPAAENPTPSNTSDSAETDLVGSWTAKAGDTEIDLSISEESQFVWTTKSPGQNGVKLSGTISGSSDGISLDTTDQGAMAGTVKSIGPDEWLFSISGAPSSDPGLRFKRLKN